MKIKKNKIFMFLIIYLLFHFVLLFLYRYKYSKRIFEETEQELIVPNSQVYIKRKTKQYEINYSKPVQLRSICNCKKEKIIVLKKDASSEDYVVSEYNTKKSEHREMYRITQYEYDTSIITCDLYNVLRRGKNQKVIAYSLYGKNRFYYDKLKSLIQQVKRLYPGWIMRIYYDDTIDNSIICDIECTKRSNQLFDNSDFCNVNSLKLSLNQDIILNANYMHKMKWRWLPIGDSFVSVFMSRDTDSYVLQREVDSVNVWLTSDKAAHIMRDHPTGHRLLMLGGMWGFNNLRDRQLAFKIFKTILNPLNSIFYNFLSLNPKGYDQHFLKFHVYGLIKTNSIIHDSYNCQVLGGLPWPTQRLGDCFVGNPNNCNKNIRKFKVCPLECRPKDHLDWFYC